MATAAHHISQPFIGRLRPAPVNGGFTQPDYWVWCGSVVKGEDGRYHMFASRWPHHLPMWAGYTMYCEIVRAVADTPEGPFQFEEIALPARGSQYWDGRMTHNPAIFKHKDTYILYYVGTTFEGPPLTRDQMLAGSDVPIQCWRRINIGVATSKSVRGPWKRRDEPIVASRQDHWDQTLATNPAACVREDGSVLLLYRSSPLKGERLLLGLVETDHYDGEYRRVTDDPLFLFNDKDNVEDPYLWWNGHHYEMLAKDMLGGLTGEVHAGVHAYSFDGANWNLAPQPKAYSRTVHWADGTVTTQGSVERPQLLFEKGCPTHLYAATCDGPGGFNKATRTWNMVIPLKA
ncbi:MAG: glycoside hydrolase family protein [Kiritimatiellota bacterium]|nr:glycoside hydrolase family protein [Kiritimatiellota bacterium]